MRYSFLETIIIIPSCLPFAMQAFSQETADGQSLDNPVKDSGTVSFILDTDKTYRNGSPEENLSQILLKLTGLATCLLQRDYSGVFIAMEWDVAGTHTGYNTLFTEFHGKACLDFTDPGCERWGPVLCGGRISFRQMAVTMAANRDFNVWELK